MIEDGSLPDCAGKFMWSESGEKLILLINEEISKCGGIRLALKIVERQNREADMKKLDEQRRKYFISLIPATKKDKDSSKYDPYLKANLNKMTQEALGKSINKTRSWVQHRCKVIGIAKEGRIVTKGIPVIIYFNNQKRKFKSMADAANCLGVTTNSIVYAINKGYRCRGYKVSRL